MFGRLAHEQRLRRAVSDLLVGCGFVEAYTYSLGPSDPDPSALALPVPLSAEQRVLRTTLLYGLVRAARHNVNVGNPDVALFEVAHVYLPTDGPLPREPWRARGRDARQLLPRQGRRRGDLRAARRKSRASRPAHTRSWPRLHRPAVQGGWVAQLDPRLLEGEWSAFELDLAELFAQVPERILYEDVITFPAVKEDLAFAVDESVPAGDLIAAAREAAGPELRDMRVFDVYRGEQVGPGKKSLAFAVTFQSAERTLSDEDAAVLRGRIVAALRDRFGAELRA